jgi:hypothetical protein
MIVTLHWLTPLCRGKGNTNPHPENLLGALLQLFPGVLRHVAGLIEILATALFAQHLLVSCGFARHLLVSCAREFSSQSDRGERVFF